MTNTYKQLTKYLLDCVNANRGYNADTKIIEWAKNAGYDVDAEYRAIEQMRNTQKANIAEMNAAFAAFKEQA